MAVLQLWLDYQFSRASWKVENDARPATWINSPDLTYVVT